MVSWQLPQKATWRSTLPQGAESAVERFLASMKWTVVATIEENVSHTGQNSLLPMRSFIPTPLSKKSFRSLIICRAAQIHVSLGGSNGCAGQLTSWDGVQKIGLGVASRKTSYKFCPYNNNDG